MSKADSVCQPLTLRLKLTEGFKQGIFLRLLHLLQNSSFHREKLDSLQKSHLCLVSEGFPFISLACYLFPHPPGGAVLSAKREEKYSACFK